MICRKYKCIFIGVPKTGSTSIGKIIGYPPKPHLDISEIETKLKTCFPFDSFRGYRYVNGAYQKMMPQREIQKRGENIFQNYFKFGFVRNPWSRTVSLYLRNEGLQLKDKMSFEEFVDWIQYSSDTCKFPSEKKNQLDWFKNKQGEIAVDYIGKFETLEEDWEVISKKMGIKKTIPHENQNSLSSKKHYSEYYNSKTKEIIRQKFNVDVEHFEYSFV